MNTIIVENKKEPRFFTIAISIFFLVISFFILPYTYNTLVSSIQLPIFIKIFVVIWFLGWIIGMLCFAFIILFEYYGIEQIIVDKNVLKVNKTVYGIGVKKKYEIDRISNMRLNPFFDLSLKEGRNKIYGNARRGGKIEFHYNQKLKSLGHLIKIYNSKEILESLKKNDSFKEINFIQ